MQSCFKAIYWQLQESTVRHSHYFCVLGEQTKFIQQIKSIVQEIPCCQTLTKSYTLWDREVINHTLFSGTSS